MSHVVLLAEDDENIGLLFRRMFRVFEPEWQLEWTHDGVEAVDYCMQHGAPPVVVTDLNMPGMTGYEVMEWLRAHPESSSTQIIVYTSNDDEATCERCRDAGARELVSKSTDFSRMRETFRRLLKAIKDGASARDGAVKRDGASARDGAAKRDGAPARDGISARDGTLARDRTSAQDGA